MKSSARQLTIVLLDMSSYTPKWIYRIPTSGGKWIYVPSQSSRIYGKSIVREIKQKWTAPRYFYHLRKGGHLTALDVHLNNKYFSRLDIQNFFGSITASRITRTLKPYLGYDLSREIAKQSTVLVPGSSKKKLMLPFGFIQSAILASICLDGSSLGLLLKRLGKDKTISLSVYMDDILVSSNDELRLTEVTMQIREHFFKSHWIPNPKKEVIASESITAFNIDLVQNYRRINDQKLMQFELEFHNTTNLNKKKGLYSYIKSVNADQLSGFS